MHDAPLFDAVDVLTRSGDARDAFLALLDDAIVDLDAHLVSDVLRSTGRVGAALDTRPVLVELCAVLRAIDAAKSDRIGLDELRTGISVHAARTDRFAAFHDARVLLRTLDEVLDPVRIDRDPRATRSQVELLHRELQSWMVDQLVGDPGSTDDALPAGEDVDDPRAPFEVTDDAMRRRAHELIEELFHGARHHPVTGLLGAAWVRGWSAVPIAGERVGEDPAELDRLVAAVASLVPGATHVLQVDRRPQPRWLVHGRRVEVGDGLRRAWLLPATTDGMRLAAIDDRARTVLTTPDLDFALVEAVEHHALLGPTEFVEQACGTAPLHAVARFREHVEALAGEDGEPPEALLEVATDFGRLRRRSR